MEEISCFDNPYLRENFIARVYLYHRWMSEVAVDVTAQKRTRQRYASHGGISKEKRSGRRTAEFAGAYRRVSYEPNTTRGAHAIAA